jgi:hypothetical protein
LNPFSALRSASAGFRVASAHQFGCIGRVASLSRRRWFLFNAGVLLACAGILYARKPDMFQRPQFWAEDGGLFFLQACMRGWSSIFEPYAGYFHFLPRLVALIAEAFDPARAPGIYVGCSLLLTLWVSARTLSERFPIRPAIACALAVVLVPDAFEVLLSVANLQWILAAGLVAVLISDDPATPAQKIHDVVAVAAVGLTGPFSTLFAPIFVLRFLARRSVWSGIIGALAVTAGTIQLICVLGHPAVIPPGATVEILHGAIAIGSRLAGSLLLGKWVPNPPGIFAGLVLAAISLAGTGWLVMRAGAVRLQRIWAGLAFIAVLAASLYRCRFVLPGLTLIGFGARYFFPLQMLLVWLLISVFQSKLRGHRMAAGSIIAIMLIANLPRLRYGALPDLHWSDYAAKIRAGEKVLVPINPAGWTIPVPAKH